MTAPVEMLEAQRETSIAPGQCLQYLNAGGDDFGTDAVTGYGGDVVGFHF